MSRLEATFEALRRQSRTGLVTYTTAGDPTLACSREILVALDRAGADVLEVGVPFSDPVADGPMIQRAADRAVRNGTTLPAVLEMVASVRPRIRAPIVLFTYANPVLRLGAEAFARHASQAGVDGVLMLDLPLEEAGQFRETIVASGLDPIFLIAPTTSPKRIRWAGALGRGFLYAISRLGVTGARATLAEGGRALVERIRAESDLPVAVGFGISRPDHVRDVGRWADAAVVGSSLVGVIEQHAAAPGLIDAVEQHVRWLRGE